MIERGLRTSAPSATGLLTVPTFLALSAVIVLLGQLQLELVDGVILADLGLAALIVWWFTVPVADLGRDLGRSLIGPFILILAGSLMAMTFVGLASWAVRDLVLDVGAALGFLAVAAAAGRADHRHWPWLSRLAALSLILVVAQLLLDGGGELRSAAGFPNPNLAAHFVVTMTAVAHHLQPHRRGRTVVLLIGAIGWLATGSFGALIQASTMIVYRMGSRLRPSRLAGLVAAGSAITAVGAWVVLSGVVSTVTLGGVSTDRLGRSSDGRFQKWVDGLVVLDGRPVGVGPGSVNALSLSDNELHNEPLAFLVERGPLALLGLILLYLVIWLAGRPGGAVRMLVVGFIIASLFRETSHYRHLWLGLAVLLAWERFDAVGQGTAGLRRIPLRRVVTV